jgi:hypothetical protein
LGALVQDATADSTTMRGTAALIHLARAEKAT